MYKRQDFHHCGRTRPSPPVPSTHRIRTGGSRRDDPGQRFRGSAEHDSPEERKRQVSVSSSSRSAIRVPEPHSLPIVPHAASFSTVNSRPLRLTGRLIESIATTDRRYQSRRRSPNTTGGGVINDKSDPEPMLSARNSDFRRVSRPIVNASIV